MLGRAAAATAAGVAGGSGYGYYWARNELGADAVERTLSFYQVAVPAFLEYKSLEFRCEGLPRLVEGTPLASQFPVISAEGEVARFVPLHEKWSPRFKDKFFELRGFYLKHGQAIANNLAENVRKNVRIFVFGNVRTFGLSGSFLLLFDDFLPWGLLLLIFHD